MTEALQKTIGRILVILLFIAPVFAFNHYSAIYKAKTAQQITREYLLDIQENVYWESSNTANITPDNMAVLSNSLSKLGYKYEINIKNIYTNQYENTHEAIMQTLNENHDISLNYLDLVTIKIFNDTYCFYESAVAYKQH